MRIHDKRRETGDAIELQARDSLQRCFCAWLHNALDVVGAFVTFQHQPGRRAMLELCRGGLPWLLQPAYVRYPARGPPAAAVAAARAVLTPEEEDDDAAIAGATEVCSRLGRLRVSRISAMNQPLLGDESATARR